MSKPTGYIVRPKDMKALVRQLNRPQASLGELYGAARTLIGWAEPQQTQQTPLPPVSVASLALPSSEADVLDLIEDVLGAAEYSKEQWDAIFPVFQILRAAGRL